MSLGFYILPGVMAVVVECIKIASVACYMSIMNSQVALTVNSLPAMQET